jgi:hypothetical protein
MIRINKWQGFISYASPYIIPAGGAVEQTNMVCLLPGQISCRAGMEDVSVNEGTTDAALEMWGYSIGNTTDKIFIFDETGDIRIEEAPSV